MTEFELQQQRTGLWRLDAEKPLRTFDDAREFFDSVGFALLYPSRSVLLPSLIGAYLSSEENARDRKKAAADPRLKDALELANRLVREQVVYEVATERGRLLVSAAEFPYFYALLGDRNPKKAPDEGVRGEQRLQAETFALIDKNGPSTKEELIAEVGKGISEAAMDRTISELSQRLRVVRVPQNEGPDRFDLLYKFAPDAVNQGKQVSNPEALSAIVARYLETVVAAEQSQIEDFVGLVSPRSRVSEVIKALTGAGEFSYSLIDETNMLRVSSSIKPEPKKPYVPFPKERSERPAREGSDERGERPKRFDRPRRDFGDRPRFDRDRGDRPAYSRDRGDSGDRPFKPRRDFAAREGGEGRPYGDRPRFPRRDDGERRGFRPGTKFGGKPAGEGEAGERPSRPYQRREGGEDRPRKSFGDRPPRKSFGDRGDRPTRPYQRREGGDDRPRKSFGDRPSRPFRPRGEEGGDRPPRKSFGDRGDRPSRPYQRREEGGDRPRKSFGDRPSRPFRPRSEEGGDRPPRKSFGDRKPFGERKSFGDRPKRSFGEDRGGRPFRSREDRPPRERREGGEGEKRPFKSGGFGKKPFGDKPFGKKPFAKKPFGPKSSGGAFKKFERPGGKSGGKFGKPASRSTTRPPRKPRSDEGSEE
jgi:hypothetical protein